MNKFNLIAMAEKMPANTLTQELIKLAAIIAATCLAAKIESIIHELSKDTPPDITGEIRYEEGK
jgi:hypothetical protein